MNPILFYEAGKARKKFISTWNTTKSGGVSAANQIRLPLISTGTYNFTVDWGDGTKNVITTFNQPEITHTYASITTPTVTITGMCQGWGFSISNDASKFISVQKWGNLIVGTNEGSYFSSCVNLTLDVVSDVLNTSGVTSFSGMFSSCSLLAKINRINEWNTSTITIMSNMFSSSTFNDNIGNWNVSNVTVFDSMFFGTSFNNGLASGVGGSLNWNINTSAPVTMANMFNGAAGFNQTISSWDVSRVTDISSMFSGATSFNNGLASGVSGSMSWNTINVVFTSNMFQSATSFNQNIGTWNMANVTNTVSMFQSAAVFNQNLNSWNLSKVGALTSMFQQALVFNNGLASGVGGNMTWTLNTTAAITVTSMFLSAPAFNQNLNSWDVSKVISFSAMFSNATSFNNGSASGVSAVMSWTLNTTSVTLVSMFSGATSFNQDIGGWNVGKVTSLSSTFTGAIKFNQSLNLWDTSSVTTMSNTFSGASVFNGNISSWNVSKVTLMTGTFQNATAFNQNIGGWVTTALISLSATFASATSFNQNLNGWDVSKVTLFTSAFNAATAFNNGLAVGVSGSMTWTLSITATFNMGNMFLGASSFNQDISSWNMTKCTTITSMFSGATLFNQPLNTWDVSSIPSLNSTFLNASSFNQPLNNWSTVTCNNLISTFNGAIAFDRPIGTWNMSLVTTASNMLAGKTYSPLNFTPANLDSIYNGWIVNELKTTVPFSAGSAKFTSAGVQGRILLTRPNIIKTVTGAVAAGGLVRLTVVAHGMSLNNKVFVKGVLGATGANGMFAVGVPDVDHLDLLGSVFGGTYTSGGTVITGYAWTITDGLLLMSNVTSGVGGLMRITTPTHGFTSGTIVYIYGIIGTGNIVALNNTAFTINVITTTTFDLQGTSFSGTYSSGGNVVLN